MYGVENRFKITFSLGLKGVPLYREIPATKNHLMHSLRKTSTFMLNP